MRQPATVERVEAAAYQIPTETPESDGTLTWDSTTLVTVQATGAGRTGTGYTYAGPAAVDVITGKLAGTVQGRDALTPAASWDRMQRVVRNLGKPGLAAEAIAAVDIALWDLYAQLADLPLSVALGAVHDATPIYGSGGFTSYDNKRLADQLVGWVDAGIPRVKIRSAATPEPTPPASPPRAPPSASTPSCTSTPTAPTPARTPSCGRSASPTRGYAGSKNPSPPTTWPACGYCAIADRRA